MIFWCRGCGDQLVTDNPAVDLIVEADFDCGCWLNKPLTEAIRRPIDWRVLLGPYRVQEYFYVDEPKEFNTVDLKLLNYERWNRKLRTDLRFPGCTGSCCT